MITERKIFWLFLVTIIASLIYISWSILLPFLLGFIIAYLFLPLARKLSIFMPMSIAAGIIAGSLCIIFTLSLFSLIPILIEQAKILNYNLPQYKLYIFDKILPFLSAKLSIADQDFFALLRKNLSASSGKILKNVSGFVPQIVHSSIIIVNSLIYVCFVPLTTFLFIKDWDLMRKNFLDLIPNASRDIFIDKIYSIYIFV